MNNDMKHCMHCAQPVVSRKDRCPYCSGKLRASDNYKLVLLACCALGFCFVVAILSRAF